MSRERHERDTKSSFRSMNTFLPVMSALQKSISSLDTFCMVAFCFSSGQDSVSSPEDGSRPGSDVPGERMEPPHVRRERRAFHRC